MQRGEEPIFDQQQVLTKSDLEGRDAFRKEAGRIMLFLKFISKSQFFIASNVILWNLTFIQRKCHIQIFDCDLV